MNINLNSCQFVGRLTRDVEVRQTQGGTALGKTAIAVNHRYKDKSGEWKDGPTLFLDLTAWGHTGNSMGAHCAKGDLVFVTGRLQLETWEDKTSGGKRSKHSLTVDSYAKLVPPTKKDEAETKSEPIEY